MDNSTFFRTQYRLRNRCKRGSPLKRLALAYSAAMDSIVSAIFPTVDIMPAHWEHLTQDRREQYRIKRNKLARLEQRQ